MAGRIRRHIGCRKNNGSQGRVVNAYVRIGSPAKWLVVGEVCIDCGTLTDYPGHAPDRVPAPKRRRRSRART